MWTYSQSTGKLSNKDGKTVATGYSGHGAGLNKPDMQDVLCTGPIPRGEYRIGPAFTHPTTGPYSLRLIPAAGTDTFGRGGFLMHGDNAEHNQSASEGCIVISLVVRLMVAESPDRALHVVT